MEHFKKISSAEMKTVCCGLQITNRQHLDDAGAELNSLHVGSHVHRHMLRHCVPYALFSTH